jgi:hypothetical protein
MERTGQIGQLIKRTGKDKRSRSKPQKFRNVNDTAAGRAGVKDGDGYRSPGHHTDGGGVALIGVGRKATSWPRFTR